MRFFLLIPVWKSEIPDMYSFIISAMAASGSDEFDMQNPEIILTDQQSIAEKLMSLKSIGSSVWE